MTTLVFCWMETDRWNQQHLHHYLTSQEEPGPHRFCLISSLFEENPNLVKDEDIQMLLLNLSFSADAIRGFICRVKLKKRYVKQLQKLAEIFTIRMKSQGLLISSGCRGPALNDEVFYYQNGWS